MRPSKALTSSVLCLAAGAATALGQVECRVQDLTYEVQVNCDYTAWQGIVAYDWYGFQGGYGVGWFIGENVCDREG